MSLKEIFLENKDRRYYNVSRVKKENMTLVVDPVKKLKENWIVLLGIFVVIIGFLLINFNMKILEISMALIAFFVVVFIYGNKAILKCDKNSLNIQQGFQKNKIPYSKVKGVFIARAIDLMLFIPTYNYNIIIRYEDPFSFIRELNFSLLCADEDEVKKFIENFEINKIVDQKIVKFEKRKLIWKILISIGNLILVIFVCMYFFRYINFDNLI